MKNASIHLATGTIRSRHCDEQWLASLMRAYYSDLFNFGLRFTRDEAMIKDCIQEVFISLWQRRHTGDEILNPKFYFLRAVKNKILKSLDSDRRRHGHECQSGGYDFLHEFSIEKIIVDREISTENFIRIRMVLTSLSKREKEVIYLKYYQLMDNVQIAELMSISRQSVYNLLHNSIVKLRMCWHEEFVGG